MMQWGNQYADVAFGVPCHNLLSTQWWEAHFSFPTFVPIIPLDTSYKFWNGVHFLRP